MPKRYVVSRKLATGGMAEVLLAARTGASGFEKLVIVKRILPHLRDDGQFLRMFLNEARLAALLKHPNIVEIYGVEKQGNDFTVLMEYLSGEDLRFIIGHLRQQRLPMDAAVAARIIADAAAALDFAHHAKDAEGRPMGVIHRDVAPGNIFVTFGGVTKLLDFGIAKATTRATYTTPGTMKGKFAYMSPEHIHQQPLDARSDLFSLGVVAWELLAARRLFKGPNDAAVLKEVMELQIPPPSLYNPQIPASLDRIVLGCVERDPGRRTPSAARLREQLEQFLAHGGNYITTSQVSQWMKAQLPWRYQERRELERVAKKGAQGALQNLPSGALPGSERASAPYIGGNTGPVAALNSGISRISGSHPAANFTGPNQGPIVTPSGAAIRRSVWPIVLASSALTLLIVALTAGFFFLGRGLSPEPAYLVVHAIPPGSTVQVNGETHPDEIGPDGVAIPVAPNQPAQVSVSKKGLRTVKRLITAPASGTRHAYFSLISR